jgi:hypothetical protein
MSNKLMVLPSGDSSRIRLVSIPDDIESQEAFRHATGVISGVEETTPDYSWEDIEEALEEQGFHPVEFVLGPALD